MAKRPSRAKDPERKMSLGQHLVELRRRLIIAALAVLAATVGGFFLYPWVWAALQSPVMQLAQARDDSTAAVSINFTSITGGLDVTTQVAFTIGIVISSPVWLYEVFAFLVPGLRTREKRYVFGFFFTAVPLFLAGCVTGWFVLPHLVQVMASFVPQGSTTFYDAKYYLDFVLKLVVATGVAFVLPVFLVLLNFVGVLRAATIFKGWRWAVLAIVLFTALVTPAADVLSMALLAVPMIALYFAAVGVAFWHDAIGARKQRAFDAQLATEA